MQLNIVKNSGQTCNNDFILFFDKFFSTQNTIWYMKFLRINLIDKF